MSLDFPDLGSAFASVKLTIEKFNQENLPGAEKPLLDSLVNKLHVAFKRFEEMTEPIRDTAIAKKWVESFAKNVNDLYTECSRHNGLEFYNWYMGRNILETQHGILFELVDQIKDEKIEKLFRNMNHSLFQVVSRLDYYGNTELANHMLKDYVTFITNVKQESDPNLEGIESLLAEFEQMDKDKVGKTELSAEKIISIQNMIRRVIVSRRSALPSRRVVPSSSHVQRTVSRPVAPTRLSPRRNSPASSQSPRVSTRTSTRKPSRLSRMRTGLGQMTSGISQRAHAFRKRFSWGGTRAFKARRLKR